MAVLGNSNEPANRKTLKEIESAAKTFEVQLQPYDVLTPKDIDAAFRTATKVHADALLVLASALLADHRTRIANLALKSRVPVMYFSGISVEAGGLMSYGPPLQIYRAALPLTLTKFSKVQDPPNYLSSSRQNSS